MGKTVSEMSKELEHIGESGSIGDLPDKLEEAETAKAEVEGQILERVSYLNYYYRLTFKYLKYNVFFIIQSSLNSMSEVLNTA
jgi:hypothetical protein